MSDRKIFKVDRVGFDSRVDVILSTDSDGNMSCTDVTILFGDRINASTISTVSIGGGCVTPSELREIGEQFNLAATELAQIQERNRQAQELQVQARQLLETK